MMQYMQEPAPVRRNLYGSSCHDGHCWLKGVEVMDLFSAAGREFPQAPKNGSKVGTNSTGRGAPLAERMRPRRIEEFVGQEQLLGEGRILHRAIEEDRIGSMILWGPPGSGKTTLAGIIAKRTSAVFRQLSAVNAGVSDIRRVTEEAAQLKSEGQRTILFVDEIHRFNKAQQDAILPHVENGTVVLIGATTENPYFEVNRALVSRSRVLRLEPLSDEKVKTLLRRAISDKERGLGDLKPEVTEEALDHLARVANGDARSALNALELAVLNVEPEPDGKRRVTLEVAAEAVQQKALGYDRQGDNHYDTVSAWIKSMRGSDPDAALYWLARMIAAGEDPRFIARRLLIHAAEDVGLADPQALVVASAAAQAVDWVGMPEARIPLAQATIYITCAPKSNTAYAAISKALDSVKKERYNGVPPHLRDAHYSGAEKLGHGKGYLYPHDHPGGWVAQQYLPSGINGGFYRPADRGYELEIRRRLQQWWGNRFIR